MSDALREYLESTHLLKVGCGLKLQHTIDVSSKFRPLGYRQKMRARAAVAIVLGMRLQKSKKITISNWANMDALAALAAIWP